MIDNLDYLQAFTNDLSKGRFNVVLAVKSRPEPDDVPAHLQDVFFALYEKTMQEIEQLTPRQIMTMFPITKTYDGDRWNEKDYYSTVTMCQEYGLDRRIQDAPKFLMDYMNDDTNDFMVNYLCFVSKKYRELNHSDMMTDGMIACKIPYTAYTPDMLYMDSFDGETRVTMPYLPTWKKLIDGD